MTENHQKVDSEVIREILWSWYRNVRFTREHSCGNLSKDDAHVNKLTEDTVNEIVQYLNEP